MSLYNEKRNADGTLDFSKTLLFSVVCINPFGPKYHDQGVGEMYPAEINRFLFKRMGDEKGFDSNTEEAIKYWTGSTNNRLLKQLGIVSPGSQASKNHGGFVGPTRDLTTDELELAQRTIRVYTLAMQILTHPEFSFSTRNDAENIYRQKADYLTSRVLTDALNYSQGDVKEFLEWVDDYGNFTAETTEMFHTILDGYIMDVNALYKRYNLVPNVTTSGVSAATDTTSAASAAVEDEEDDDLFGSPASAGGKTAKSAATTEQEINDILDKWF
jgi:hypothetical protein